MEKYGFSKNLLLKSKDNELIDVSKEFLQDIEDNFQKFKNIYKNNKKNLEKYLENDNFPFDPEKLSKKSPLTLNAPWGSGKTFFVENFVKLFIDKKLTSDIFKRIITIDAWKFSNSKDMPYDFIFEFSNKIIELNTDSKKFKKKLKNEILKKLLSILSNIKEAGKIKFGFSYLIGYFEWEWKKNIKGKKVKKYLEKIKNAPVTTIIFIDNIERLGKMAWDLLKVILRIQEFDNYLIILTTNLEKLSDSNKNETLKNNIFEYPIEKYIDFNYYNLEQDYLNFFIKYFKKNNKFVEKLNIVFKEPIDGKNLSIREIENVFNKFNFYEKNDEDEMIKIIREKIWYPRNCFELFSQIEAKEFIEYEKQKYKIFIEIKNIDNELYKKGITYPYFGLNYNKYQIGHDYLTFYEELKRLLENNSHFTFNELYEKSVNYLNKKIINLKKTNADFKLLDKIKKIFLIFLKEKKIDLVNYFENNNEIDFYNF